MKLFVKNNHLILRKEYNLSNKSFKYLLNHPEELEDIRLFILEGTNFINAKLQLDKERFEVIIIIEINIPDDKYLTDWDLNDFEELMNSARRSIAEKSFRI